MFAKIFLFFAFVAIATCAVLPAAYIAPYSSSYNEHHVQHAVASPVVAAAPLIASPAIAAPAIAAPAFAAPALAAYSAFPSPYIF